MTDGKFGAKPKSGIILSPNILKGKVFRGAHVLQQHKSTYAQLSQDKYNRY